MNDVTYSEVLVKLLPDEPVAVNEKGCWTLVFTAGESGLGTGSVIHLAIPHGFTPPQIDTPGAPGFVTLGEKKTEAALAVAVGHLPGTDTQVVTSCSSVCLIVERTQIRSGESFSLIYGAGEAGAYAAAFAGPAPFRAWVCADGHAGSERFLPVRNLPVLNVQADELAQLEVVAPSGAQPGTPVEMRVIGRDALDNRCAGWRGWFRVEAEAEGVLIPASQRNEDTLGEGVTLDVGLSDRASGVVRLRVRESDADVVGVSNPILVGDRAPFWGDMHACLPEDDASRPELDFLLNVGSEPTLHKASFHFQTETAQEAIGQPSSGFLRFSLPDAGSDEMLPSHLLEIYSCWGNREYWGARYPDIRLDRHSNRTVQGVLAQGIIAGFAAGSNSRFGVGRDARRAEAGRGYSAGLTAVYADSLDQDDLFTALRERQCYATTGARMLLQMDINGYNMGRVVEVSADDEQTLHARQISAYVSGTAPIERLEVVRNNAEICTYRGDGADLRFQWADEQDLIRIALPRNLRGGGLTCYYYVRVIQEDGHIAWSSPIWFMLRRG